MSGYRPPTAGGGQPPYGSSNLSVAQQQQAYQQAYQLAYQNILAQAQQQQQPAQQSQPSYTQPPATGQPLSYSQASGSSQGYGGYTGYASQFSASGAPPPFPSNQPATSYNPQSNYYGNNYYNYGQQASQPGLSLSSPVLPSIYTAPSAPSSYPGSSYAPYDPATSANTASLMQTAMSAINISTPNFPLPSPPMKSDFAPNPQILKTAGSQIQFGTGSTSNLVLGPPRTQQQQQPQQPIQQQLPSSQPPQPLQPPQQQLPPQLQPPKPLQAPQQQIPAQLQPQLQPQQPPKQPFNPSTSTQSFGLHSLSQSIPTPLQTVPFIPSVPTSLPKMSSAAILKTQASVSNTMTPPQPLIPPQMAPAAQLQPLQKPATPPKFIPPKHPLPQTPAQKAEEERKKQEEIENIKKQLEGERQKRAEEDRKKLEEALQQKKQEEEAKRRLEDEKKRRKSVLELEEMKHQIAARLLKEEEEKRQKLEAERYKHEEEMKKTTELFQQKLQLQLKEEEERIRKEMEERLRIEKEKELQKWEAAWKQRAEEEKQRLEAEEQRRREKEEALIKEHEERLKREREERMKWEQQLAEIRAKEEEERKKRLKSEKHLRKQARREARKKMTEEVEKVKQREEEEKKKLAEQLKAMEQALEQSRVQQEQVAKQKFDNLTRTTQLLNAEKMQAEMARIAAENKAKEEADNLKKTLEEQFRQEELALKRQFEEEKRKLAAEASARLNTNHFEIDLNEIEIVQTLGQGAFGEVFKGVLHGKEVAVKKLFNQNVDDDALSDFRQEITIMSNLHHPNLLLFMGACTRPGNFALVTELMPRGSLEDIIFTQKLDLPLRLRLKMLKDAAMGMNWLHRLKPSFLHRDLKTGNLLVDENWTVKVADFGLSSIKSLDEEGNKVTGAVGSPFYMAPEVLVDKEYDEKADVYSFAIIVWEVLSGEEPYKNEFESFEELVEAITLDNQRPAMQAWFPPTLRAFLESLWADSPEKRPSFEFILRERKLDTIAIDCMMKDALANDFWKTNFSDRWDSVPWTDFVKAFNEYFEKPLDNNTFYSKCSKVFLTSTSGGKEVVTIDDFIKVMFWFGPLDPDTTFLSRISILCAQPWFFADISQAEAETILKTKKPSSGSWLVRFGEAKFDSGSREYILSVNLKGLVNHHKFTQNNTNNKYCFKSVEYPSLDELIKANKKSLKLKTPCTGSKFEIFAKSLKPPHKTAE